MLNLEHLKTRIARAVECFDYGTLSKVEKNVRTRIEYAIQQEGKHMEQKTF